MSAPPPTIFTINQIEALYGTERPLDLREDLFPLMIAELAQAHYRDLFLAHPERVTMTWADFSAALSQGAIDPETGDALSMDELLRRAIPEPDDRFDLGLLDHPLADTPFDNAVSLARWMRGYVLHDAARRSDREFSPDSAVVLALLDVAATMMTLTAQGRFNADTVSNQLDSWWFSLFASMTSGAPGFRLEELEALSRAGLVHFIGAGLSITYDPEAEQFLARSTSQPEFVTSRILIDARLPNPTVTRCTDPLVASMIENGLAQELSVEKDGALKGTGRLFTNETLRLVQADGSTHPARFAVGPWTSGTNLGGFARPRTNSAFIRQNDALAIDVLKQTTDTIP